MHGHEKGKGGASGAGGAAGIRLLPGYRTDVTGLTRTRHALFVLTTGGAHEDLGLGTALARYA